MKSKKADRLRPDLIPPEAEAALSKVYSFGTKKHGERDWELDLIKNPKEKHWESFCRHVLEHKSGKEKDEESGLPPIYHAFCRLSMYITLRDREGKK